MKSSINLVKNVTKEKRRLEIYVFPYIGDMDIKSITPTHIIEMLKKIETTGKLETTKRIFALLNQIYKSAKLSNLADIVLMWCIRNLKKLDLATRQLMSLKLLMSKKIHKSLLSFCTQK
ncbi:phage integrase central domain-containing protein [Campylobacter fetus]|uniref:phage integrase central domain-containing protein n=1 Tax=Campylobacter fetus TaxID=196 RepID=UPI003A0FFE7E